MSEVKRYMPNYTETGRYLNMIEHEAGEYVLHTDYVVMKDECDELAKALLYDLYHSASLNRRSRGECPGCGQQFYGEIEGVHKPNCPVSLAERILKETPNER